MMHSTARVTRRQGFAAALGAVALLVSATFGAPLAVAASNASGDLVLVAGATGRTGQRVVAQLLAKHYRVRALVRSADKAKTSLPQGAEVVVGDVRDPATIAPAMVGVKYVISTIGASGRNKEPGNGSEDIDNLGNAKLVEEARKAKVAQFVLVSSMGTSHAEANPMEFMRPILQAKLKGENAVRASGVPYTIVQPGGLTDDAGGKVAVAYSGSDSGMGRIPRDDVATVCIEALGRKSALGKSISIVSGTGAWPNNWDKEFKAIKADSH